ncbi:cobyric acid synthase [Ferrimicrobium sp.]|uniref:cobyric acid synthase n=1 Tax=Ferrimicrobium sp. TaxID=2926050 RepID=UPI002621FE0D|nr:cobyric acid synthase [Ferrimicrobium sp.]
MTSSRARGVLIAGTGSNVGKSLIVTGLLRWCRHRGIAVAPFKGQNMALNSAVTIDGGEVARAQAVQARAAGVDLSVAMNPVLIKPTGKQRSQLIVRGRPVGEIASGRWIATKRELLATVVAAFEELSVSYELIIAEGAGSAAEINLLEGDLANLRFAQAVGLGTVLVGDLEPGGVLASIYGHYTLLPEAYRSLLRGFVINRVRGDGSILQPGIEVLTRRLGTRWFGNLPMIDGYLPGEDAINLGTTQPGLWRPTATGNRRVSQAPIRVRVVELPYLANYTDFDPLTLEPDVDLRFVRRAEDLGDADLVILPGTKATVTALSWLRSAGFAPQLERVLEQGCWLLGICGGYQILAEQIDDSVESEAGHVNGLGLLRAEVVFEAEKVLANVVGVAPGFHQARVAGYQIHHGRVLAKEDPFFMLEGADHGQGDALVPEGASREGQIYGTTLHGLFDEDTLRSHFLSSLARSRGRSFTSQLHFDDLLETSLDHLGEIVGASLDVFQLLGLTSPGG